MPIFIRGKANSLSPRLAEYLTRDLGCEERFALVSLWRNWDDVMGPLAGMVMPLGSRDRTLIVGVEDSAVQQEMHYYGPMIVDNANAFLEKKVFDKVRVELLMGKTPLTNVSGKRVHRSPLPTIRPKNLGALMESIPPDSPVGRSYRAYIRMFDRQGRDEGGCE